MLLLVYVDTNKRKKMKEIKMKSKEIFGEENQKISVAKYGYAIRYIYNPSEEVQRIALKTTPSCIEYFKKAWKSKEIDVEKIKLKIKELQDLIK